MIINNPPAIDLRTLNESLEILALPNNTGSSVLSRKKDENGVWQPCEPYLVIKCDSLTAAQEKAVTDIIAAHVVPQPVVEDLEEATLSPEENKALRALLK